MPHDAQCPANEMCTGQFSSRAKRERISKEYDESTSPNCTKSYRNSWLPPNSRYARVNGAREQSHGPIFASRLYGRLGDGSEESTSEEESNRSYGAQGEGPPYGEANILIT